jgi:hypothetical protein
MAARRLRRVNGQAARTRVLPRQSRPREVLRPHLVAGRCALGHYDRAVDFQASTGVGDALSVGTC